jgi:hypothetical protein
MTRIFIGSSLSRPARRFNAAAFGPFPAFCYHGHRMWKKLKPRHQAALLLGLWSAVFAWLAAWILSLGPALINDEYAAIDYFYRIVRGGHFYPTPDKLHKPLCSASSPGRPNLRSDTNWSSPPRLPPSSRSSTSSPGGSWATPSGSSSPSSSAFTPT